MVVSLEISNSNPCIIESYDGYIEVDEGDSELKARCCNCSWANSGIVYIVWVFLLLIALLVQIASFFIDVDVYYASYGLGIPAFVIVLVLLLLAVNFRTSKPNKPCCCCAEHSCLCSHSCCVSVYGAFVFFILFGITCTLTVFLCLQTDAAEVVQRYYGARAKNVTFDDYNASRPCNVLGSYLSKASHYDPGMDYESVNYRRTYHLKYSSIYGAEYTGEYFEKVLQEKYYPVGKYGVQAANCSLNVVNFWSYVECIAAYRYEKISATTRTPNHVMTKEQAKQAKLYKYKSYIYSTIYKAIYKDINSKNFIEPSKVCMYGYRKLAILSLIQVVCLFLVLLIIVIVFVRNCSRTCCLASEEKVYRPPKQHYPAVVQQRKSTGSSNTVSIPISGVCSLPFVKDVVYMFDENQPYAIQRSSHAPYGAFGQYVENPEGIGNMTSNTDLTFNVP